MANLARSTGGATYLCYPRPRAPRRGAWFLVVVLRSGRAGPAGLDVNMTTPIAWLI